LFYPACIVSRPHLLQSAAQNELAQKEHLIMATPFVNYCEQINPKILHKLHAESPRTPRRQNASRVQQSFLAAPEKRLLIWIAQQTPSWITPDHLTVSGFLAQIFAGVFYALSRWNRCCLLAVIFCLALNWLGDSLDGTLARVRQRQRPAYGFYVDHMIDSLGALCLMTGLALSTYMHPYLAIALLIAFLLLSIQSYLATYALGEFHLSFWKFGPTELRLLLAVGNIALLFRPMIWHARYRLFDVAGAIGLLGMTTMLLFFTAQNTCRLYQRERL
jgi:archaetidylinositol phosphate synthase